MHIFLLLIVTRMGCYQLAKWTEEGQSEKAIAIWDLPCKIQFLQLGY